MTIQSGGQGRRTPKMFRWLYPSWIALCAILFLALGGAEDPSRPKGRILSLEAGRHALAIAETKGFENYEVVHVARSGERWVVLLDRVPHTRLAEAVVIELRVEDGTLLRVRKPA